MPDQFNNGLLYYSHDPSNISHEGRPVSRFEQLLGSTTFNEAGLIGNLTPFSRGSLGRMGGQDPDPRRNLNAEAGFPQTISALQYQTAYERSAPATRAVEVLCKESWRVTPSVFEDDDPENVTEFEQAWDALGSQLHTNRSFFLDEKGSVIWDYLLRADIISGIGQYGCILLGLDDGLDLSLPVEGFEEWNSVAPAVPIEKGSATAGDEEEDPDRQAEIQAVRDETQGAKTGYAGGYSWPNGSGPGAALPSSSETQAAKKKVKKPVTNQATRLDDPVYQEYVQDHTQVKDDGKTVQPYLLTVNKAKTKGRKLLYLRVFSELNAAITRFETNRYSPRFGQPVQYLLTFNNVNGSNQGGSMGTGLPIQSMNVHWTRIVHIKDETFASESEVFGVPRLRPIFNQVCSLDKVYAGGPEGYWQACIPTIFFETHPQLGGNVVVNESNFKNMRENMRNGSQRDAILKGMAANPLALTPPDPTPFVSVLIEAMCYVLGVPVPVFKGYEIGEQASENNDATWDDRCAQRQQMYVTPKVVVPFTDRLVLCGVLPEPKEQRQQMSGGAKAKAKDPDSTSDATDVSGDDQSNETEGDSGTPAQNRTQVVNAFERPNRLARVYTREKFRTVVTTNADTGASETKKVPAGTSTVVVTTAGYSIEWPDLSYKTLEERATTIATLTTALAAYAGPGNASSVMPPAEYFVEVWGMDEAKVEQMLEAAQEHVDDQHEQQLQQQQDQIDAGVIPDPTQPQGSPVDQTNGPPDPNAEGQPKPNANPFQAAQPVQNKWDDTDFIVEMVDRVMAKNAFCATGKGGGIKPTCGTGSGTASADKSHESKINLVRTKGNTNEGVTPEQAKTLTNPADIHKALKWQDNMTFVVGSNGPNKGLPDATRPKLSDLERGALQKYSYKNDGPLNQHLRGSAETTKEGTVLHTDRGGNRTTTPYHKDFYDEMHSQMQSAFSKAETLPKPIKVVRGMNLSEENLKGYVAKMQAAKDSGQPHEMQGYTSTTKPSGIMSKLGLVPSDKQIAKPFRGNVSIEIHAVHGIDMKPHTQLPAEGEFLINHGSKMAVKSVTQRKDGGWHVVMHQHPPGAE